MPDQVLAAGLTALGTVLLLVRAVVARDEPWWVAWPAAVGATATLGGLLADMPWLLLPGVVVLVAGLGTQLLWAFRRGRYLEDDVHALWRSMRGRPARRAGRHRLRDDG